MSKVLIWDLPTRVLHWLFAAGFLATFGIAQFAGHRSSLFPFHMILGISLGTVILMRIVWGVVGSRYARFGAFLGRLVELPSYLTGALFGGAPRYAGHNPGSAAATFAMLGLGVVVVATGVLIGLGSEAAEEIHGAAAWALAAVVALHVVGVGLHSLRHRENLAAAMLSGRKEAEPAAAIASARPLAAVIITAIVAVFSIDLARNFDRQAQATKCPLTGVTIPLGEKGHGEKRRRLPRPNSAAPAASIDAAPSARVATDSAP